MELKNDSIREVIQKEGIKSAKDKFGKEVVTNELKKDFELVREILNSQPSSAFNYYIYEIIPSEVSHFFEKDIIEFQTNRVMQELPNANREDVIKDVRNDFDKSIVRKEYTEKGDAYQALYRRMEFVIEKYGQDRVDAFLNTEDPKLRQNLIEFGQIKEKVAEEFSGVEEEQLPVEDPTTVEEEQKAAETSVEEPAIVEEEQKATETPEEKRVPVEREQKVAEAPVEENSVNEEKTKMKNELIEEISEKKSKPIDPKKLSPKAIKLIKKVKILCKKCKNENNIVKKHLLKFKLRMLITRLQEEIDLYYLKEEYRIKAEEIKAKTAIKQRDDILAIVNINKQIKQRENILKSYSEYDYYSPDFMFSKSLVEKCGGINEFAKQLQEDDNPTIQIVGKNISGIIMHRDKIQELKKQIEDRQKDMELREKEALEQSAKPDFVKEEKHIALREPNIIFARIKEFFKIAKISIQDFRTEILERRELAKEYKQKEEELKEQFDLQMKQLREDAEKAKSSSTTKRDTNFMQRMRENVTEEPIYENIEPENTPEIQSESRQEDESELTI